jgi:hypothetical protein
MQIPIRTTSPAEWHALTKEVKLLENIRIDRTVMLPNEERREYHGWADASVIAIAGCLHCASYSTDGQIKTTLIMAKTKITPRPKQKRVKIKTKTPAQLKKHGACYPSKTKKLRTEFTTVDQTSPFKVNRAELKAAVLLVEMIRRLKPSLKKNSNIYLWSDSAVTLTWITNRKHTGIEFIDSRLRFIWKHTNVSQWRHCPTQDNPADIASRGMPASELIHCKLWLHGPDWLQLGPHHWPRTTVAHLQPAKIKPPVCGPCKLFPRPTPCTKCAHVITPAERCQLFEDRIVKDSTEWTQMLKRWVLFLRLQRQLKAKFTKSGDQEPKQALDLRKEPTVKELLQGERSLIREIQQVYAHEEWIQLTAQPGKLQDGIFYDSQKRLLMSRSRQYRGDNEPLSPVQRDLIYFPTKTPLQGARAVNRPVELMYRHCHLETVHGSIAETFTRFRFKYWSSKARKIALSVQSKCPFCVRFRVKTYDAPQGPLPTFRCEVDELKRKPFRVMGIDFLGPFVPFGTADPQKLWILVCSCTLTRALLLRTVQGLDLKTFRHTFNQLCFDYNLEPETIISDRAETFQGAYTRLVWAKQAAINHPSIRGNGPRIQWHFNASRAPWWGGFFERMMRMIKGKLAKLFMLQPHKHFPSLAAFNEAMSWVQLVLNSRPISWEPTCGRYGQPVLALDLFLPRLPDLDNPFEVEVKDVWLESASRGDIHRAMETRAQWQAQLWNLFTDTYLAELRKRRAEQAIAHHFPLIDVGQVVFYKPPVIGREQTPMGRLKWRMARVTKLHPGRDGHVRSADIEYFCKETEKWCALNSQSIKHLAPLEVMLQEAELRTMQQRNEQRRAHEAKVKANQPDTPKGPHARYALRSRGPVIE